MRNKCHRRAQAGTMGGRETMPPWIGSSLAPAKKLWKPFYNPKRESQSLDGNANHLFLLIFTDSTPYSLDPSKDNSHIISVQVLKEMPLISRDLMLYPVSFWRRVRPEISIFAHMHPKSASSAKPKLKMYLFYYTMAHKALQGIFLFELSGKKRKVTFADELTH